MMNKKDLINFLLPYYRKIQKGVKVNELDAFLEQYNITIRGDHREFLLKFGGGFKFFVSDLVDCTFDKFKDYYVNDFNNGYVNEVIALQEIIPENTTYFGLDFFDILCIDNEDGALYYYDNKEKDLWMCENIDSFVFLGLINNIFDKNEYIESSYYSIKIDDVDAFIRENEPYKVKGLSGRYFQCYVKENMIIISDVKNSNYNLYSGGILNKLQDRFYLKYDFVFNYN